jgi:8-oxo-dGTP pyrophosphatase MutT (NUDIX family)
VGVTRDNRSETVLALLRAYTPTVDERADLEEMLELLDACDSPFDRTLFAPGHFTASGFVVSPDRGAVLLVHHRRLGRWLQPGGHVDPNDVSVEDAARREIEEETGIGNLVGLGGLVDIDVHAIPSRQDEPAHRHFDLRFAYTTDEAVVTPAEEVHDARWVAFDRIASTGGDESVLRGTAKLRDRLGRTSAS